ncbi:MAG TPA: GntR family transcriptional regulator [Candidatus Acidoferrales bacterium]|nr:GntR family transcriptional regulator [Candidatus Acidoferrales bacterium]
MLEPVAANSTENVKSLDTRTLKDQVVRLIRGSILSGKISPGVRLNESQLARELGVSRVPIREALQQLELQGLVVNVPRRGKFVISLSEEEIQQINSLRLILEAEALRLCRAKITPELIATLNELAGKMHDAIGLPEMEAAALDLEFHRTIWQHCGNELLVKTLEGITVPVFAHRVLWRAKRGMLDWASPAHHELMIDFIQSRTQESAEKVMLTHLSPHFSRLGRFSSLALSLLDSAGSVERASNKQ